MLLTPTEMADRVGIKRREVLARCVTRGVPIRNGRIDTEAWDSANRECPDGGRCHHGCTRGCYRVATCGPLSGVYEMDKWPASVRPLADHDGR